jgi:hypothetical protein
MAHAAKLGALTDDLITSITPSTRVRLSVLDSHCCLLILYREVTGNSTISKSLL